MKTYDEGEKFTTNLIPVKDIILRNEERLKMFSIFSSLDPKSSEDTYPPDHTTGQITQSPVVEEETKSHGPVRKGKIILT